MLSMTTSFNRALHTLMMVAVLLFAGGHPVVADHTMVRVLMKTSLGDIQLELYPDQAPATVANFLRYVDGGHYDGGTFYRSVTRENDNGSPVIEVIQGGILPRQAPFPGVVHETTRETGILHTDGVISMARSEPGTAASEFFICIGEQPGLDYGQVRNADKKGFAAFGRVVSGMDVVEKIHRQRADAPSPSEYLKNQILSEPVKILSVTRVNEDIVDHVILAVPDLAAGQHALTEALGIKASVGGKHPGLGTANSLLSLGGRQYLEILGPQDDLEELPAFAAGIAAQEKSNIPTYAVAAEDLELIKARAEAAGIATSEINAGSRRTPDGVLLKWKGLYLFSEKYKGLVPFYIDWDDTPHPGETSPQGATLKSMTVVHPDPEGLREIYHQLGIQVEVRYGNYPAITLEIEGEAGTITLLGAGEGLSL